MEDGKLPLTAHLSDLRRSILVSIVSVMVAFLGLFQFSDELFRLLTFPLTAELRISLSNPYVMIREKAPTSLVFLAPAEAFWMHLKVSFISALILSLPIIFVQLWRFISPGLLAKEKRYLLPFILSATGLFLTGAAFCFLVILPFAMTFLLGYKTASLTPMISVGSYIDFSLKFILAFGVVFELPLVIIFLTRFGIVSPELLARSRKYAVLGAFVAAAVLTPTPDAFNQSLMAVPIIILYEIGILLSRIVRRRSRNG